MKQFTPNTISVCGAQVVSNNINSFLPCNIIPTQQQQQQQQQQQHENVSPGGCPPSSFPFFSYFFIFSFNISFNIFIFVQHFHFSKNEKKEKKGKKLLGDIPQGYNNNKKKNLGSADNRNRGLSHVRST